ncbi:MAG TPA: patatin-like phospholipase family protein [Polyangiales bacterium]
MRRKRIAIACQGGGSQCAFVAGVLKQLFADDIHHAYHIVGLSGTSGGALTAAVAWYGLLKQAHGDRTPVEDRVMALWRDLTAQTVREILLDNATVRMIRLYESGLLPSYAVSPASPLFQLGARLFATVIGRPEFTDLRALLRAHIDFDQLALLCADGGPSLLLGAADVLDGTFKVFNSMHGEISVESLLASAAIPTLFPAVWVDGHAYWDGIFSANPPVSAFIKRGMLAELPEEVWIVQVNRQSQITVPESPSDIVDRRNQLAGNLSLQHELQLLEVANMLLRDQGLTDEFRSRYGLCNTEPIGVRSIRMSEELQKTLDYPSKLSRQPRHIAALIADGEKQAAAFVRQLGTASAASMHVMANVGFH